MQSGRQREILRWAMAHAVSPPDAASASLAPFHDARVVFLGETDHFVAQKHDFRLWWLQFLASRKKLVVAEELGWSDGQKVNRYLQTGDEAHLRAAATFGGQLHRRADRNDLPTGIFKASIESYPHQMMRQAHTRLYAELRKLNITRYYGFDVDAPGGGYDDISKAVPADTLPATFRERLAQVNGESLGEEAARLQALRDDYSDSSPFLPAAEHMAALIDSLKYTALVNPAPNYESTRPAMALREDAMKRRVDSIIASLASDEQLVLLGHAFHLAKDDSETEEKGVGPGGGLTASLGDHVTRSMTAAGQGVCAAWMVLGAGQDSQPLRDLPQHLEYPRGSLNSTLLELGRETIIPVAGSPLKVEKLGHLYGLVAQVNLKAQADALHFFPSASPLADA